MPRVHSAMLKQQCHMPGRGLRCTSKGHKHLHLGVMAAAKKQSVPFPPGVQIGCLPRACECSMPLAHHPSIHFIICEAYLLLQTLKHCRLACNECICAA